MPRQSFLSTDFFVPATEENALKALGVLPHQNKCIQLVKENNLLHTMRFSIEQKEKAVEAFIDVSVLPLNDLYVRFCLHGFYADEKRIEDHTEIELLLSNFEKSVYAALNIDYPIKLSKTATKVSLKNILRLPATVLSMIRLKEA